MGTPCSKREQFRSVTLTHPLGRKSPQSAEVLLFRNWKVIQVRFWQLCPSIDKGWLASPHPPVLLEKADSTFANKETTSIRFQVYCRVVGTDPAHLVLSSSVFLPFFFSSFPLGLVAHSFIVQFLRSVNSNRCGRGKRCWRKTDRHFHDLELASGVGWLSAVLREPATRLQISADEHPQDVFVLNLGN